MRFEYSCKKYLKVIITFIKKKLFIEVKFILKEMAHELIG